MDSNERVLKVLRRQGADRTPFTIYKTKLPQCDSELALRMRGLCPVERIRSYSVAYPNLKMRSESYVDSKGRSVTKRYYETPAGTLTSVQQPAGFTTWSLEKPFKGEDDYKILKCLLSDAVVKPNYDYALKVKKDLGGGFTVRDNFPLEPLQEIMINYMGIEEFSYQWKDNQDMIMELYHIILDTNRQSYEIVAQGPLDYANYGGNVIPQVIGKNVFDSFYVPNYNEAAQIMHKYNKLVGCHFDAENGIILDSIAKCDLDYIEAYDLGMNVDLAESKRILKDKVLWLNWPSAWHLNTPEKVQELTYDMLKSGGHEDVIIGITEDVPEERWRNNFKAIMDGIDQYDKEVR